jgi:hypothetical protein
VGDQVPGAAVSVEPILAVPVIVGVAVVNDAGRTVTVRSSRESRKSPSARNLKTIG